MADIVCGSQEKKEGKDYCCVYELHVYFMAVLTILEAAVDPMCAMMERIKGGNVHLKKVDSVSPLGTHKSGVEVFIW